MKTYMIRLTAFLMMILTFVSSSVVYASEPVSEQPVLSQEVLPEEIVGYDGVSVTMLAGRTNTQILSFVITTKNGGVIIVDGGLKEDASYLAEKITEKGGKVDAWLLTHAHKDHTGALAEILKNDKYADIQIEKVYSSFPDISWAFRYESSNANDLLTITDALKLLPDEKKQSVLVKGDQIVVDNVPITILNQLNPNIMVDAINNTSIVYSMEIGTKRMIFLGDLGLEGGKELLKICTPEELKCDIVQMAHHGQLNIGAEVYTAMKPKICMWASPSWLWYKGKGNNEAYRSTLEARKLMQKLGATTHYISKDGDQTLN